MFFVSDNGGPVHPQVMAALHRANEGHAVGYGACDWTARAVAMVREVFEAPEAEIHLVPTGTAANAIGLAALSEPWRRTFCSDLAHIQEDEWGAPAFYGGGAELALIPQSHGRIAADDLGARIHSEPDGRRGPVSLTQVTERGTVYSLAQLADLTGVARAFDLPVHLDGARFANAAQALGCSAAEMTEGVDMVSFGGTKNGCMGVEAIVRLTPDLGTTVPQRRYRGGHTFSKHRYLAAQMVGYLENGLWRDLATEANRKTAALAQGLAALPDVEILHPVDANLIFVHLPEPVHDRLAAQGAVYDRRGDTLCRLVCDWSVDDDAIARFLDLVTEGA